MSRNIDMDIRSLSHKRTEIAPKFVSENQEDNGSVQVIPPSQASAEGTDTEAMWIEKDILPALAGTGRARVYHTKNWWSQVKTAGAAVYANRHYLDLFRRTRPERLAQNSEGSPRILENVFIHHGAKIHPDAVVSIRYNVV